MKFCVRSSRCILHKNTTLITFGLFLRFPIELEYKISMIYVFGINGVRAGWIFFFSLSETCFPYKLHENWWWNRHAYISLYRQDANSRKIHKNAITYHVWTPHMVLRSIFVCIDRYYYCGAGPHMQHGAISQIMKVVPQLRKLSNSFS